VYHKPALQLPTAMVAHERGGLCLAASWPTVETVAPVACIHNWASCNTNGGGRTLDRGGPSNTKWISRARTVSGALGQDPIVRDPCLSHVWGGAGVPAALFFAAGFSCSVFFCCWPPRHRRFVPPRSDQVPPAGPDRRVLPVEAHRRTIRFACLRRSSNANHTIEGRRCPSSIDRPLTRFCPWYHRTTVSRTKGGLDRRDISCC